MKWVGETRIPRHLDTPAVIQGGIHDAAQTMYMRMWPEEYHVIRNPKARLRRFGRQARRPIKQIPWWQAGLVWLWLGLIWVWTSLEPEVNQ